jgi:hypothetical protein
LISGKKKPRLTIMENLKTQPFTISLHHNGGTGEAPRNLRNGILNCSFYFFNRFSPGKACGFRFTDSISTNIQLNISQL